MQSRPEQKRNERSEFLSALGKGALIGLVALGIAWPTMWVLKERHKAPATPPVASGPVAPPVVAQSAPRQQAPAQAGSPEASQEVAQAPGAAGTPEAANAPEAAKAAPAPHLADFNGRKLSDEATLVANWAAYTRDHKKHAFVIIDKKHAHSYTFGPDDKLIGDAPVLLGKAIGDDSAPDIGTRPLNKVKEYEKTTPAGRFVAEPGVNTHGEDIIWVSYDLAVSMHRVRKVAESEHRFARLASPTYKDNRISYGCINNVVPYYEHVLAPTVKKYGAIIYVLPDVKDVRKLFHAFDPTDPVQVAQERARQRS
jgi:hypothetical protein